MNKNIISIITLLTLLLCGVNSVFSQEWETVYYSDEIVTGCDYNEAIELSNGNVIANSLNYIVNNVGAMFSSQPTLSVISNDGTELYRKVYIKPGLCETSCPFLFEKNNEMYMLTTYTPDHDVNSKNYFKNFENPPTESIIGLYKLDEMLNVAESYEHTYPIDTFERRDEDWYNFLNYHCGYIHLYSAFDDEGDITGSYIKTESVSDRPRHDSVFFFRMDFDGNFLIRKGYELEPQHGMSQFTCKRQQIVKSDNGYVVYYRGNSLYHHGTVEYYDEDFNHIDTKYLTLSGMNNDTDMIDMFCVERSNHNTTYLCTQSKPLSYQQNDRLIQLYELDDDINNSAEVLPVLNHIERNTFEWDRTALLSLDMAKNGDVYFTYNLNCGLSNNKDSWIMIERLDSNFDTISTFFYDEEGVFNQATCISTTKDDGLLLVSYSYELGNISNRWSKVSKFPASAFVNIDEAHAHGLKVAVAYPNPGGDVMNVRTTLRNATLSVYDMQGRKVHEQEVTDDITSVDTSRWSSGTYVWELKAENGKLKVEEGKWVK